MIPFNISNMGRPICDAFILSGKIDASLPTGVNILGFNIVAEQYSANNFNVVVPWREVAIPVNDNICPIDRTHFQTAGSELYHALFMYARLSHRKLDLFSVIDLL